MRCGGQPSPGIVGVSVVGTGGEDSCLVHPILPGLDRAEARRSMTRSAKPTKRPRGREHRSRWHEPRAISDELRLYSTRSELLRSHPPLTFEPCEQAVTRLRQAGSRRVRGVDEGSADIAKEHFAL